MAEGARLESVFRGNSNVGSNPTLSAINSFQDIHGNPRVERNPLKIQVISSFNVRADTNEADIACGYIWGYISFRLRVHFEKGHADEAERYTNQTNQANDEAL